MRLVENISSVEAETGRDSRVIVALEQFLEAERAAVFYFNEGDDENPQLFVGA